MNTAYVLFVNDTPIGWTYTEGEAILYLYMYHLSKMMRMETSKIPSTLPNILTIPDETLALLGILR